jgi:uncharacterized protein YdaU (DUF1376 family)
MRYCTIHMGDWLRATAHLSPLEEAIYWRLIVQYYLRDGDLPNDMAALCRLIRINDPEAVGAIAREFFELSEDRWIHHRCDKEIAAFKKKSEQARVNGKLGGRPQETMSVFLTNPEETRSVFLENPEETESVFLANPEKTKGKATRLAVKPLNHKTYTSPTATLPAGFQRFWEAWPRHKRKVARDVCLARWRRMDLEAMADDIVRHVESMKASIDWQKDGGEYIPAPLVYLRQERYLAPPPASAFGNDAGVAL